jgi:hypothetical protein
MSAQYVAEDGTDCPLPADAISRVGARLSQQVGQAPKVGQPLCEALAADPLGSLGAFDLGGGLLEQVNLQRR